MSTRTRSLTGIALLLCALCLGGPLRASGISVDPLEIQVSSTAGMDDHGLDLLGRVVVVGVNSQAGGLAEGDRIVAIDGSTITDPEHLAKLVGSITSPTVVMNVERVSLDQGFPSVDRLELIVPVRQHFEAFSALSSQPGRGGVLVGRGAVQVLGVFENAEAGEQSDIGLIFRRRYGDPYDDRAPCAVTSFDFGRIGSSANQETLLFTIPIDRCDLVYITNSYVPSLVDLDDDGVMELLVRGQAKSRSGDRHDTLTLYGMDGRERWRNDDLALRTARLTTVCGHAPYLDVDRDGSLDLMFMPRKSGGYESLSIVSGATGALIYHDASPSNPDGTRICDAFAPAVLDAAGVDELPMLLHPLGNAVNGWPKAQSNGVLVDVTGDGFPELIAARRQRTSVVVTEDHALIAQERGGEIVLSSPLEGWWHSKGQRGEDLRYYIRDRGYWVMAAGYVDRSQQRVGVVICSWAMADPNTSAWTVRDFSLGRDSKGWASRPEGYGCPIYEINVPSTVMWPTAPAWSYSMRPRSGGSTPPAYVAPPWAKDRAEAMAIRLAKGERGVDQFFEGPTDQQRRIIRTLHRYRGGLEVLGAIAADPRALEGVGGLAVTALDRAWSGVPASDPMAPRLLSVVQGLAGSEDEATAHAAILAVGRHTDSSTWLVSRLAREGVDQSIVCEGLSVMARRATHGQGSFDVDELLGSLETCQDLVSGELRKELKQTRKELKKLH